MARLIFTGLSYDGDELTRVKFHSRTRAFRLFFFSKKCKLNMKIDRIKFRARLVACNFSGRVWERVTRFSSLQELTNV